MERRNVCGADCGNVISRYVAVGRPFPRGVAILQPTTSFPFRREENKRERERENRSCRRHADHAKVSARAKCHRNFFRTPRVSFLRGADIRSDAVRPRRSESSGKIPTLKSLSPTKNDWDIGLRLILAQNVKLTEIVKCHIESTLRNLKNNLKQTKRIVVYVSSHFVQP